MVRRAQLLPCAERNTWLPADEALHLLLYTMSSPYQLDAAERRALLVFLREGTVPVTLFAHYMGINARTAAENTVEVCFSIIVYSHSIFFPHS